MKRTTVTLGAALIAASALLSAPAAAQFAKPEDAVKYRKSVMTLMSAHVGRIAPVVRGDRPFNAAEVQANAALVETLATLPWSAYAPGTDKGDTRVKADVWSSPDKFKGYSEQLQKAAAALSAAARSGSLDQVKAAFGETGRTCKGCHDDFRKD